jgi:hypothetical protein
MVAVLFLMFRLRRKILELAGDFIASLRPLEQKTSPAVMEMDGRDPPGEMAHVDEPRWELSADTRR